MTPEARSSAPGQPDPPLVVYSPKARLRIALVGTAVLTALAGYLLWQGANLQTGIVIAGGGSLAILSYLYWGDVLAPPVLWISIWTIGLSLGQLQVWLRSTYAGPWSGELWSAFVGAAAAFTIGAHIAAPRQITRRRHFRAWSRKRLDLVILGCFFVGSLTYVYSAMKGGGFAAIPAFADRPAEARQEFGVQGTSYFLLLLAMVVPLVTVSVLFHGGWRKNRQNIALAVIAVAAFLTTANRSIALEVMSISFFAAAMVRGMSVRTGVIGLTVFAAVFVAVGLLRQIGNVADAALFSSGTVGINNPFFAMAYLYFGTAYNNLQYIFDNVGTLGFGTVMLRAPLEAFGFGDVIKIPQINWDAWNTTTALANYYYDFGVLGVIGTPLVLGWVTGRVYVRCRMQPTGYYVIVYGIAATAIIGSITTDRFFEGTTLLYIVVAFFTRWFCERPHAKRLASETIAPVPLPGF